MDDFYGLETGLRPGFDQAPRLPSLSAARARQNQVIVESPP